MLRMENISKSFPGVKALDNVKLEIGRGEVHALLGENGAGKSTLMKLLNGIHRADEGKIYIDDKEVDIHDIETASQSKISIVHQELCLAPNLSVAENIFIGRVPQKGLLNLTDINGMKAAAAEICHSAGLDLDPATRLGDLTISQQQMVEIAKAVSVDARIIVMDEPTSSLTQPEVRKLFEIIQNLKSKGVSIIYISHRMEEIFEICDRVTVLRDGRYVGSASIADVEQEELINMMVGRELSEMFAKPTNAPGEVILEVQDLWVHADAEIEDVSFNLRKGEILAFYGLVGSGRSELMEGIFGMRKKLSGRIRVDGSEVDIADPLDAIKLGMSFVPEDRKEQGLVLIRDIGFNITMEIWDKIFSWLRIDRRLENSVIRKYMRDLSIKAPDKSQLVKNLSGGNQQKVLIARALAAGPTILILDEPTRGVDVGAKKEIYELIHDLAHQGLAVIMISSELPEVINMSHRVAVMSNGKLTDILEGDKINPQNIMLNAIGSAQ